VVVVSAFLLLRHIRNAKGQLRVLRKIHSRWGIFKWSDLRTIASPIFVFSSAKIFPRWEIVVGGIRRIRRFGQQEKILLGVLLLSIYIWPNLTATPLVVQKKRKQVSWPLSIRRGTTSSGLAAQGGQKTLLLSCTLRAWRSVPLWTATITSMATRACAPG